MRIIVFDHMDRATEQEVERMLPLVSPQRREQALQYKHTLGRFCCLKSWLMLRELLEENGMEMSPWQYNGYGKPFLSKGPFFSISHCKEAVAVALSENPIGIDIEGIRHVDDSLVERTMNGEEQTLIRDSAAPDRAFTRLWTRKEAILKCKGTGIGGFDSLRSSIADFEQEYRSVKAELKTEETPAYIYSLCSVTRSKHVNDT